MQIENLGDFITPNDIQEFQIKIRYKFTNTNLLLNALVHSSFQNETNLSFNNERLEFLGDSVVSLVISSALYLDRKKTAEGELSKLRSSLVNASALSRLALSIGLEDMILLGKGEIKSKGHLKESILCDAFEALLGAIYLDSNFDEAKKFLMRTLATNNIDLITISLMDFDPKSRLQELVMKEYKSLPEYKSEEVLIDRATYFQVELFIEGKSEGCVQNISKKKAMQILAKNTLKNKFNKETLC